MYIHPNSKCMLLEINSMEIYLSGALFMPLLDFLPPPVTLLPYCLSREKKGTSPDVMANQYMKWSSNDAIKCVHCYFTFPWWNSRIWDSQMVTWLALSRSRLIASYPCRACPGTSAFQKCISKMQPHMWLIHCFPIPPFILFLKTQWKLKYLFRVSSQANWTQLKRLFDLESNPSCLWIPKYQGFDPSTFTQANRPKRVSRTIGLSRDN